MSTSCKIGILNTSENTTWPREWKVIERQDNVNAQVDREMSGTRRTFVSRY